jgi:LmbE family N-acetylglucosaminyl deacetylase
MRGLWAPPVSMHRHRLVGITKRALGLPGAPGGQLALPGGRQGSWAARADATDRGGARPVTADTLVVSPHLDDAVLSCGHFLLTQTRAVVATVFAGDPGPGILSDWDRECGFSDGDNPVVTRWREDRDALTAVGAEPIHLEFLDSAYGAGRSSDGVGVASAAQIAARLGELVDALAPARVLIPLGLLHPDHEMTHDAGALLLTPSADLELWAYQDLPYGAAYPDVVSTKLETLRSGGIAARPITTELPRQAGAKRDAVGCYASQVIAVRDSLGRGAWESSFLPGSERFWLLTTA